MREPCLGKHACLNLTGEIDMDTSSAANAVVLLVLGLFFIRAMFKGE